MRVFDTILLRSLAAQIVFSFCVGLEKKRSGGSPIEFCAARSSYNFWKLLITIDERQMPAYEARIKYGVYVPFGFQSSEAEMSRFSILASLAGLCYSSKVANQQP